MSRRWPDFVIIGAMKSGTTTLHHQLARRPGLFMSPLKEPNFFSDDAQYERGADWYCDLFRDAEPHQRCGEASTHYTKRPTYPHAVARMRKHMPDARLVYVVRDPLERLVSQYIHEWTECQVDQPIDAVVSMSHRYVDYSCYARQLEPYLKAYGPERVLLVFFEHLVAFPNEELERICRFVGDPTPGPVVWDPMPPANVSAERTRRSALRENLVAIPGVRRGARRLLPRRAQDRIKDLWRMRRRPELRARLQAQLQVEIDADLGRLGRWLGVELDCERWHERALEPTPDWTSHAFLPGREG